MKSVGTAIGVRSNSIIIAAFECECFLFASATSVVFMTVRQQINKDVKHMDAGTVLYC